MTPQSFPSDSIGPEMTLDAFRLPPHVGDRLATLFGCAEPITDGSEWVDAMRSALTAQRDDAPTEADLCHAADGAHTIEIEGERESFVCVLDPLVLPFLCGAPGRIESTTPSGDDRVTVQIDADGAAATPETAVVSLGISHHVDEATTPTLTTVYRQVCGYIHVFPTPAAYERWAGEVEAATTSVPVETGVAVARELATTLFDSNRSQ